MPASHNTDAELLEIAAQGLRKGFREIAHRELDATTRKNAVPWRPADARGQTAAEDRDPHSTRISAWEPRRPSGGNFPMPARKARSWPLPRPGAFPEKEAGALTRARRPARSRDGLSSILY